MIRIETDTLAGSGKIYARGGEAATPPDTAAGAGRVAIYCQTMSLPAGNIFVHGGKSYDGAIATRNGGAGTIYLKAANELNGQLIIDNKGVEVNNSTTPLSAMAAA